MPRFVRQSKTDVVQALWWEPWEKCAVGKYNISQRDAMNAALVEVVGPYGEIPEARLKEATVPVLAAGLRSWTFRDLDEEELAAKYRDYAEKLGKDVAALTDEDKCDAVEKVPIVPLGEEWIRKLDVDDAVFVASAVRRKNRGRTDEEEREFLLLLETAIQTKGLLPAEMTKTMVILATGWSEEEYEGASVELVENIRKYLNTKAAVARREQRVGSEI